MPTIEVTAKTLQRLNALRTNRSDAIDVVIRRLLATSERHHWSTTFGSPRMTSRHLPRTAYYDPILEAVRDLGGAAKASTVVSSVGKRMSESFGGPELVLLASGARWQAQVNRAVVELLKMGLLVREPRGTWRLTSEGMIQASL